MNMALGWDSKYLTQTCPVNRKFSANMVPFVNHRYPVSNLVTTFNNPDKLKNQLFIFKLIENNLSLCLRYCVETNQLK